ncbi:MAG: PIN domain-containing protein [Paracoccaceae bacterium]
MRVLLDACIIFPTVMREVLMGVAGARGFTPLWSTQIFAEWQHAATKLGPEAGAIASGEMAVMNANWPGATVDFAPDIIATLYLPDRYDRHVLAAAIAGDARVILTKNRKDFPNGILAEYGLIRRDPDEFLLEMARNGSIGVAKVAQQVQMRAQEVSGRQQPMRALLKRAGLPRLGKHLAP